MIDAESIREYRRTQGLTQRALAERLGVSVRSVKRWESGKNPSALARRALFILRKEHNNMGGAHGAHPRTPEPCPTGAAG